MSERPQELVENWCRPDPPATPEEQAMNRRSDDHSKFPAEQGMSREADGPEAAPDPPAEFPQETGMNRESDWPPDEPLPPLSPKAVKQPTNSLSDRLPIDPPAPPEEQVENGCPAGSPETPAEAIADSTPIPQAPGIPPEILARLTPMQLRFVDIILADPRLNASRAARLAGFSWPYKQGPRLASHPIVRAAIEAGLAELDHQQQEQENRRHRERLDRARAQYEAARGARIWGEGTPWPRGSGGRRRRRRQRPTCM